MGSSNKNYNKTYRNTTKEIYKTNVQKDKQYPSDLLYKEDKLLDPRELYVYNVIIFQHRNTKMFIQHPYKTRNKELGNLEFQRIQKKIGPRSITYLGPKLYNLLKSDIRKIHSIHTFKLKT